MEKSSKFSPFNCIVEFALGVTASVDSHDKYHSNPIAENIDFHFQYICSIIYTVRVELNI